MTTCSPEEGGTMIDLIVQMLKSVIAFTVCATLLVVLFVYGILNLIF